MNDGWIKWHRRNTEHPLFRDPLGWHVWEYLCLKAAHEPHPFIWKGKEMTISRGQLIFGRAVAADETGLNPSTIRNKLKLLENLSMISRFPTNKFTIISICNYNKWQNQILVRGQQEDNRRTTGGQQEDTYKKKKEFKNTKKRKERDTASKKSDAPVHAFFRAWDEMFQKEMRERYTFTGAKEGNLIKRLLKTNELPRLMELAEQFILSTDEWTQRAGKTIAVFSSQINKLKTKPRSRSLSEKTQRNLQESAELVEAIYGPEETETAGDESIPCEVSETGISHRPTGQPHQRQKTRLLGAPSGVSD